MGFYRDIYIERTQRDAVWRNFSANIILYEFLSFNSIRTGKAVYGLLWHITVLNFMTLTMDQSQFHWTKYYGLTQCSLCKSWRPFLPTKCHTRAFHWLRQSPRWHFGFGRRQTPWGGKSLSGSQGHIDLVLKELIAKLLADLYLPQKKVKSPPFL